MVELVEGCAQLEPQPGAADVPISEQQVNDDNHMIASSAQKSKKREKILTKC